MGQVPVTDRVAVAVLGAGPAGLVAAAALGEFGKDVLVLERGGALASRSRHIPEDLVEGVGGAGLYSDGKFSFYPSASRLWHLSDEDSLTESYDWFRRFLAPYLDVPPFPKLIEPAPPPPRGGLKAYPSSYVDLDARKQVIASLAGVVGPKLLVGARVNGVLPVADGYLIGYHVDGVENEVHAQAVIWALGRFGPLVQFRVAPWTPSVFLRYEVGIRLESSCDVFALQNQTNLDPKWIAHGADGVEWRTFCTCRNGEVVTTRFESLVTLSGRADDLPTPVSNVGVNLRLTSAIPKESSLSSELRALMAGDKPIARGSLTKYLQGDVPILGGELDALLVQGLRSLDLNRMPGATVAGPTIEGVGHYPEVDNNLALRQIAGTWVVGDGSGVFRGLTPSMVSGRYAARQASIWLDNRRLG